MDIDRLMKSVGAHISKIRKQRGLSQEGLAYLAGLSVSSISQIENGINVPTLPTFLKIAVAFELPLEDLLPGNRFSPKSSRDHYWEFYRDLMGYSYDLFNAEYIIDEKRYMHSSMMFRGLKTLTSDPLKLNHDTFTIWNERIEHEDDEDFRPQLEILSNPDQTKVFTGVEQGLPQETYRFFLKFPEGVVSKEGITYRVRLTNSSFATMYDPSKKNLFHLANKIGKPAEKLELNLRLTGDEVFNEYEYKVIMDSNPYDIFSKDYSSEVNEASDISFEANKKENSISLLVNKPLIGFRYCLLWSVRLDH